MEKKSCGAILYAFNPEGKLGVILGEESRSREEEWLPFKGGCQEEETLEQAAIREIFEETCGLVLINSIALHHKFSTKRKEYHIGLVEVPYELLDAFAEARKHETRENFMEKRKLKFFLFPDVLKETTVHNISKSSILFYKDTLEAIAESGYKGGALSLEHGARYLGISNQKAEILKQKTGSSPDLAPVEEITKRIERLNLTPPAVPKSSRRYPPYNTTQNSNVTKIGLLSRPKRFTMSHTPRAEKIIEQNRVWRNLDTGSVTV